MSPPCSREQYISAIVDYILKETPEQQAELLALGSEKDRPGGRRVFDAEIARQTAVMEASREAAP